MVDIPTLSAVTTESVSSILAVLAFVSLTLGLGSLVLLVRFRRGARPPAREILRSRAGALAAAIAAVSMSGSLYYSEIANFEPCLLCWWQRIFMYPIALTLVIGQVIRRPVAAWQPLVLAGIGSLISAYHYWLQVGPSDSTICDLDNPCSARWVDTFGIVSIPFMAFCGFVGILGLSALRLAGEPSPSS